MRSPCLPSLSLSRLVWGSWSWEGPGGALAVESGEPRLLPVATLGSLVWAILCCHPAQGSPCRTTTRVLVRRVEVTSPVGLFWRGHVIADLGVKRASPGLPCR